MQNYYNSFKKINTRNIVSLLLNIIQYNRTHFQIKNTLTENKKCRFTMQKLMLIILMIIIYQLTSKQYFSSTLQVYFLKYHYKIQIKNFKKSCMKVNKLFNKWFVLVITNKIWQNR